MTKTFEDTSPRSSDAHQAEGGRSWLDRRFAPWVALAVLTGAAVLLVLYETRGTIFWYDEWQWITERRDFTASTFLEPHNQHLSLVPVAVYRFMLETVGIDQYWPYRLLLVVALAASGSAIFLYARPRVGPVLALAATALILFLGPGAQNILWPFQIGWLISVAAGIGALLALDRHARRADVGAALLLGVSLASSGVGIPFVVAAAVDVALGRQRWRDGLIVAAPLVLYGVWWLAYQEAGPAAHLAMIDVPQWVLRAASASLLGLFGLVRPRFPIEPDVPLFPGVLLLLAVVALGAWRLWRLGRVPPRVIALLAGILTFWTATAVQRGITAPPGTNRYLYVGSLFLVLLAVELGRGTSVRPRVAAVLGVIALAGVAANIPLLRQTGAALRADGDNTRIAFGVLEVAGDNAGPREPLTILPGYPLVVITAPEYFAALRAWGPFEAAPPSELAGSTLRNMLTADRELVRLDKAAARRVPWRRATGAPPTVDAISAAAQVEREGACVQIGPEGDAPPAAAFVDFTVPASGLLIRATEGDARIRLRRFGPAFVQEPLTNVRDGTSVAVTIPPDRAPQPWHVHVEPRGRATICRA